MHSSQADAAFATTPGATPGASGVEDAEGYFHHDTLGTKIKNLATGKSHEERAKQRAAKHKLVRPRPRDTSPLLASADGCMLLIR